MPRLRSTRKVDGAEKTLALRQYRCLSNHWPSILPLIDSTVTQNGLKPLDLKACLERLHEETIVPGSFVGNTVMGCPRSLGNTIFFLSFLAGKSLSLPAMTLPGWTRLKSTKAMNMGSESRQYWYASWFGIELVRPLEYSAMRNRIRS